MAVMKTDKDLAEIYRRGRRTSNRIAGRPEDEMLESKSPPEQHTLDKYRIGGPNEKTDEYLYQQLALIPFYAGVKAGTVVIYRDRIKYWFRDYRKVAGYSEKEVKEMMADPKMFCHEKKIRAATDNAREFQRIVKIFGSFIQYIFSFNPHDSLDNLRALMKDMRKHFAFYGPTVTKHYLLDIHIGLPLIKPDLNIMRTFYRIGLVDRPDDDKGTWAAAITMAGAANVPVPWVDFLVKLGMKDFYSPGSEVCGLEPDCNRDVKPCDIKELCEYWKKKNPNKAK
jgi:3-methyladenine DNA glycosylase Tag